MANNNTLIINNNNNNTLIRDNTDTLFKIKRISILSTSCYNLENNTDCTICRMNLNCNSIYADEKNEESFIITGICGHSFHNECITNWLKPNYGFTNKNCAICSNNWVPINNTKSILTKTNK